MRIIAGTLGGRKLKMSTSNDTRPTSDKLRGAIFNALGQYFEGGRVLDVFAGSGAMSFEAISRGFAHAICIDKSKDAVQVIKQNTSELDISDKVTVHLADFRRVFPKLQQSNDLIIIDPPYELKIIEEVIGLIETDHLLTKEGVIVLELSNKVYDISSLSFSMWDIFFNRRYGTTQIMMLKRGKNYE